jgi:hypothetical protein
MPETKELLFKFYLCNNFHIYLHSHLGFWHALMATKRVEPYETYKII